MDVGWKILSVLAPVALCGTRFPLGRCLRLCLGLRRASAATRSLFANVKNNVSRKMSTLSYRALLRNRCPAALVLCIVGFGAWARISEFRDLISALGPLLDLAAIAA
jgi:hypothetical protein